MTTTLPEPLSLPWELKPVSSARAGSETLADGRTRLWVKHEVLKGVTPAMLVWWFAHLEGDVEIDGRALDRYRVWHPFDHVSWRYVRRAPDGSIGPGAQMALCEVLARDPRYTIDVVSTIEKLDEEGFIHKVVVRGFELARMEHTFRETSDGVLDENCLIVPGSRRLAFLSKLLVPRRFPEPKGRAWLKHNIEETGALENFLPELYARKADAAATSSRVALTGATR
jgi:DAPG hydrolase PhiG domain